MFFTEITTEKIHPDRYLEKVADDAHGAQVTFCGVIRNHRLGRKVLAVSYDAFEPLVKTTFTEIGQEMEDRFGRDTHAVLVHRTGKVVVGEVSVVILVSAAHRDEAYRASRFIIEQVKHRSPIWKQEHFEDGDSQWVEGHALCQHASIPDEKPL